MLCHVSGSLFSPARPERAGPAKEGRSPSRGCCWPTPKGPLLLPGMGYHLRASSTLLPTSCKSAPSTPPFLCLTLANPSSLFLSFAPSWPPCPPGDFRHPPPDHLRSLAFALWPSNSSFSSAAASPQFSATGSTSSHKKADLPGRPFPFAQTTCGFPRGVASLWTQTQNLTLLWLN